MIVQYTTPPYISLMWKDMSGGVVYWTVLCYHPYLVFLLFMDLLSLHLVTILMFLLLFVSLFLAAGGCLSWSLPSITEQQEDEEEEEEDNDFGRLVTSVLSWWFFHASGHIVRHEKTQRWWHIAKMAYMFTIFEILRFFVHICMSVLSLHIDSTGTKTLLCACH